MGMKPRKHKPATTCTRPDRHEPKLTCGYPLPCPHHTVLAVVGPKKKPGDMYKQIKATQLWCDLQEYRSVLWLAASMADHLELPDHAEKLREVANSVADGARAAKAKAEGEAAELVPGVYVARRCGECNLRAVRILEPAKGLPTCLKCGGQMEPCK